MSHFTYRESFETIPRNLKAFGCRHCPTAPRSDYGATGRAATSARANTLPVAPSQLSSAWNLMVTLPGPEPVWAEAGRSKRRIATDDAASLSSDGAATIAPFTTRWYFLGLSRLSNTHSKVSGCDAWCVSNS